MTTILLIDTSADTGTIAISVNGAVISRRDQPDNRNHAASINVLINEALAECGITMQQLSAVAVCAGPGSYTGLRIGMSTAKGICFALNKPLILNNKLTLLANQACVIEKDKYDYYLPLLTAREKEYFVALYNNKLNTISEPAHIVAAQIADITKGKNNIFLTGSPEIGTFSHEFVNITHTSVNTTIDIDVWALYATERCHCNDFVNLSTAEPFYLKQVYTHK